MTSQWQKYCIEYCYCQYYCQYWDYWYWYWFCKNIDSILILVLILSSHFLNIDIGIDIELPHCGILILNVHKHSISIVLILILGSNIWHNIDIGIDWLRLQWQSWYWYCRAKPDIAQLWRRHIILERGKYVMVDIEPSTSIRRVVTGNYLLTSNMVTHPLGLTI